MEPLQADWLCNDFLSHCLQHEENKQNVVVTNFYTAPATPSDNCGSCLFRVLVEYKDDDNDTGLHSIHLIIKSEILAGSLKEMFDVLQFSEPIFYNKFIPEANKLTSTYFAPKSFFSPKFSVVVLEDLREQGFMMADRLKQLDFEHCLLYIDAAALFHAVSFATHKDNPELIESIGQEKMFVKEMKAVEMFKNMINSRFKCLFDATQGIKKFSKYSELIQDVSGVLWEMLVEAHKPRDVLNTLTQGDPWTANMMFKYDDHGFVTQVKLLDFQALRYGSPVNDIIFFIWSSANHDVRENSLDNLYRIYIDTLNKRLQEFNCNERLTYESFMDNVLKLSPMVIFIVGVMLPSLYDPDPVDFGVFLQNRSESVGVENPYKKYYNMNFCNNHLPHLLEQLESTGVFEYLDNYLKHIMNLDKKIK